ncbi:MAG: type II CAAX endopeptidase family protein [Candidatus Krumholzibacteria bacterium]|nr:type II CAAX endopeptidase family protein [Candidatus Krumholzibacteria bacterium]
MQPEEHDNQRTPEVAPDAGGPKQEPVGPPPGLFERVNNYLLLVYAGACLLMHYSLAGLFYIKGMIALALSLPGIFAILLPLFLLSRRSPLGFAREFSLRRLDVATTALVIPVAAAAILPVEALSGFFERMWAPDADYTSFILSIKPKGPASFFFIALGVVAAAAVAEELLFRGFIQRIFQRNMSGPLAVVLAGLIFALSHFNPPALLGIAALGILYGYIFYRTGNLWYSILAHAIYNLVTLVRLNAATEEEIVSPKIEMPPLTWTLLSLAVLALSLWLLERLRRAKKQ